MHRFVLAEFNTHRIFSRNSASSRAIPVQKRMDATRDDTAYPVVWPAEQPGMQGGDSICGRDQEAAERIWDEAAFASVRYADALRELNVHKSVINRILEPYLWHTVVVSSTEWENFFRQRCSPLAQPEIRLVAEAMREALQSSIPTTTPLGEWHTPYVHPHEVRDFSEKYLCQISAARCARVSYLTQDGVRDPNKDWELYQRLVTADPPHASPLEHVATPAINWSSAHDRHIHQGNFTGWSQLRHEVLG